MNRDSIPDSFLIVDKSLYNLSLDDTNQNGSWDRLMCSTGASFNSIAFVDTNMDGIFDLKIGHGKKKTSIGISEKDF